MLDSPPHLRVVASNVAAGAVAKVGKVRTLLWAVGLLKAVRRLEDLRDVGLILIAVVRA